MIVYSQNQASQLILVKLWKAIPHFGFTANQKLICDISSEILIGQTRFVTLSLPH